MKLLEKQRLEARRRVRIRSRVRGTADRPRLALCLSNKHAYAQCIDDEVGKTLASLSSMSKDIKSQHIKPNRAGMEALGKLFGALLKSKGIERVVFDRSGRLYFGCVRTFADAVRQQGIQF